MDKNITNVIIVINNINFVFMHWKSKYTKADYKEGVTRLKRCFAWLPVYIGGTMYWLEEYEILQVYILINRSATIDGEQKQFILGKWESLSKRLCE